MPAVEIGRRWEQLQRICESLSNGQFGQTHTRVAVEAVTAMLIGAVAVAQTVDDEAMRVRFGESCWDAARALLIEHREEHAFLWSLADLHQELRVMH